MNKKLIIKLNSSYKKNNKHIVIILIILGLIILILNIINTIIVYKIILNIIGIICIIIGIYFSLSNNVRIEIENNIITKYNIFKQKKYLGKITDITAFSTLNNKCLVLSDLKVLFAFYYKVGKENKELYTYLLNNCNKIIPIYKCLQVYNLYLLFLIFLLLFPFIYLYLISRYALLLLIPFLGFIIYIYVRLSKPCLIITAEKIIYYVFHHVKEINLTDITKIEFLIHRNRYKMMIDPSCHDLIFYNKNNKILKCPNIYYDDFNRISAKVKPYNIKILRR